MSEDPPNWHPIGLNADGEPWWSDFPRFKDWGEVPMLLPKEVGGRWGLAEGTPLRPFQRLEAHATNIVQAFGGIIIDRLTYYHETYYLFAPTKYGFCQG